MDRDQDGQADWPLRPWLLAGLGLAAGLILHGILGEIRWSDPAIAAWRIALAGFVGTAAVLVAFTLERARWVWSLLFAGVAGAVVAMIFWWNGAPAGWGAAEGWRTVCAFLSIAIAAPLFQAARDEGAARFPYAEVHGHAWANVVIWCAACAFVGIVFLLTLLLSELFQLIGISVLKDLLQKDWFTRALAGLALGGGIGVLRERDRVVRLLLTVVVAVLRVLAPVLAVGLALFLLSLPFTGLAPLWDATRSTTPILLACVIGALILVNAVVGATPEEDARFAPLKFGAMLLAAAMLPLAIIAAVSTGTRIQQYGFTPDRLWALVFVIVATAYGLTYLVALVRGRMNWADALRPANLKLAFGLCALALFLALPILSFNAISTRDQVARLQDGRTKPEKFDFAALAYDFGAPGRAALARLEKSGNSEISRRAVFAAKSDNRYVVKERQDAEAAVESLSTRIRILPQTAPLPVALRDALVSEGACGRDDPCTVIYTPGASEAISIRQTCARIDAGRIVFDRSSDGVGCNPDVEVLRLEKGAWASVGPLAMEPTPRDVQGVDQVRAYARGPIEVRSVTRRQVFIDGKPVGAAFE